MRAALHGLRQRMVSLDFSVLILVVCGLAAAGIVAYSILFYRRGVAIGAQPLQEALQRSMGEEGEDRPSREDMLEALDFLKGRFLTVTVLSGLVSCICIAASILLLVFGTSRELGFVLLGVSWVLAAGAAGLLITRALVPILEEHLQDKD